MATLVAPEDFSPGEDALAINRACQGWGTDEKAIISILGHRNAAQRKQIRLAYQEIYLEDLTKQLKSELSGDLERAICHWILDPVERDAVLANEALKKARPDYRVILETAYMKSPEELLAVKRTYQFLYKRSLEEDVASHTTGDMRRLLIAVVSVYRYEGEEIDEGVAHSEANILGDEIQGGALKGEEIIRILSTRSKAQLIATFNNYKQIHGTSITKSLRGDPTEEFSAALRAAIRCIRNPKKYLQKGLIMMKWAQPHKETNISTKRVAFVVGPLSTSLDPSFLGIFHYTPPHRNCLYSLTCQLIYHLPSQPHLN